MNERRFCVLLGPDAAGKSSVMAEIRARRPEWRLLSTDDALVPPQHALIGRLRRNVVDDVLPALETSYSADFLASLLQTAVVYLRDEVRRQDGAAPILVDSYYYKILAKCRLAGVQGNPMYTWWRSFQQPQAVVYLDVSPESAWRRSADGTRLNPLEHHGARPEWPGFESYQKNLRKLLLEEVRDLPVTIIEEQPSVGRAADAVLEALAS